jgi:tetratricopeptide (TPR) repeat protein
MEIPGISARLTKTRGTVDKLYASRLAFDTAESFLKSEDYMEAVSQYKLVLPEDSNYEKAQEGVKKASDGYRVKAVAAAEALAEKEDYAGAMAAMGAALKVLENDTEFMQKRTLYEAKYVSRTASDADALAAEGKYDDAVTLLQEALKTVPGNADLTAKATEITNSKPGVLSDLVVIDSQKYEAKTDIFVDSFGNKYYESYEFTPEMYNRSSYYNNDEKFNSDRAYAVYNANKGYKTFSADIVAPSGLDSDAQFLIEVYTDENIEPVWSTWDYSVRTGAAHIDINISGITKLNITVWVKNAAYYSGYPIRLVNTALTR